MRLGVLSSVPHPDKETPSSVQAEMGLAESKAFLGLGEEVRGSESRVKVATSLAVLESSKEVSVHFTLQTYLVYIGSESEGTSPFILNILRSRPTFLLSLFAEGRESLWTREVCLLAFHSSIDLAFVPRE